MGAGTWSLRDVFLLRLEMGSGECFVGVTGISNPFELRLEIVLGRGLLPVGVRPAPEGRRTLTMGGRNGATI